MAGSPVYIFEDSGSLQCLLKKVKNLLLKFTMSLQSFIFTSIYESGGSKILFFKQVAKRATIAHLRANK